MSKINTNRLQTYRKLENLRLVEKISVFFQCFVLVKNIKYLHTKMKLYKAIVN